MKVGELCNREVVVTGPRESVREAVKLMREYHVGDVVVVEERNGVPVPIGILTDRDVVIEILAEDVDPDALFVGDVMSYELVTAAEQDEVLETVRKMRTAGVRRVPVVDAKGGLVGIVTLDDLLDLFAEYLGDLVVLVRRERHREERRRE